MAEIWNANDVKCVFFFGLQEMNRREYPWPMFFSRIKLPYFILIFFLWLFISSCFCVFLNQICAISEVRLWIGLKWIKYESETNFMFFHEFFSWFFINYKKHSLFISTMLKDHVPVFVSVELYFLERFLCKFGMDTCSWKFHELRICVVDNRWHTWIDHIRWFNSIDTILRKLRLR